MLPCFDYAPSLFSLPPPRADDYAADRCHISDNTRQRSHIEESTLNEHASPPRLRHAICLLLRSAAFYLLEPPVLPCRLPFFATLDCLFTATPPCLQRVLRAMRCALCARYSACACHDMRACAFMQKERVPCARLPCLLLRHIFFFFAADYADISRCR